MLTTLQSFNAVLIRHLHMCAVGTGNAAQVGAMPLFDCLVALEPQAPISVHLHGYSGPAGHAPCWLRAEHLAPPCCKQRCKQQSLLQLPSGTAWHLLS